MSFLSFNPADSDQLCIGGASGLYFWRVDNLVDNSVRGSRSVRAGGNTCRSSRGVEQHKIASSATRHGRTGYVYSNAGHDETKTRVRLLLSLIVTVHQVISPTKARAPAPPGKGKRNLLDEDCETETEGVAADPNTLSAAERASSAGVDCQTAPGAALAPAVPSTTCRASAAEGSRPETADAAGAVAAAEIVQLESLVTMGDGKHDAFTCHCWGLEGTLWAANEPGQLVRMRVRLSTHLCQRMSLR